jgi:uncharacterized protein
MDQRLVRPLPTLAIGLVGGFIVGMTSVGSGSLIIVALMLLYPTLSSREMVGTDLVQAIPLVGAAALGHVLFGNLQMDLTASVLLGAIPGVYIGAHVSARASDRYIRPALVAVLTISSLKLLNATNAELLAASIVAVIALGVAFALFNFDFAHRVTNLRGLRDVDAVDHVPEQVVVGGELAGAVIDADEEL